MEKFNKINKNFYLINYIKHLNFFFIIFRNNYYSKQNKTKINYVKLKISNSQIFKLLNLSTKTKIFLPIIKSSAVFIKFSTKTLLFKQIDLLWGFVLAINLNNKTYTKLFFKNFFCFSYKQNKKLLYKFFILKLKKINSK